MIQDYCIPDGKNKRSVSTEDYNTLQQVIEDYQQEGKNCKQYLVYSVKEKRILVYYSDDKNTPLNLSPSYGENEIYNKFFKTILQANGGYQPCENVSQLCSACKVFGMVA